MVGNNRRLLACALGHSRGVQEVKPSGERGVLVGHAHGFDQVKAGGKRGILLGYAKGFDQVKPAGKRGICRFLRGSCSLKLGRSRVSLRLVDDRDEQEEGGPHDGQLACGWPPDGPAELNVLNEELKEKEEIKTEEH